ncbi:MAG TPA: decaprenyl-phosphate phosphoribosyltransferase [Gemmatimonadaceae bacterium]|nr:decaprenyl-phosphate phosphoribosyltransferase [Gemmatimonadaceae bacterium]
MTLQQPGSTASAEGAPIAPVDGLRATTSVWLRLLRPRQWLKNGFVLAPLLFSGRATDTGAVVAVLAAFALFCALASGVYILNDVADREVDRVHPVKRQRPVAAGIISPTAAAATGAVLIVAGLLLAFMFDRGVGLVVSAYVLLNVAYTLYFKRVVILDVFAIAAFFVLRLLAGTSAIDVVPSVWLLLCGGLLSLFLGFAKRRHELRLLGDLSGNHRAVLGEYSVAFLDQVSSVLLAVTVVSYIMYTLTSDTAVALGSEALAYSSAFVLYGVFRYLYLVHTERGGDPAETLLGDRTLLATVVCWALYCGVILYRLT